MRKKHFKLGMGILIGLASYFIALSVMVVASASGSDSRGFGFSISKKSRAHSNLPDKQAADSQSGSKSIRQKSTIHAIAKSESEPIPCLVSTTCNSGAFEQDTDRPSTWNEHVQGGGAFTNGQDTSNGNNFPGPSGSGFFAAGSPFGPFGTGGDGNTTQNSNGRGSSGDHTATDLTNPGLPFVTLGTSTLDQVPQLSQDDPASSSPSPGDNSPSQPALPSNPPVTLSVPEPPTFWIFLASLILLVARFVFPNPWCPSSRRNKFGHPQQVTSAPPALPSTSQSFGR